MTVSTTHEQPFLSFFLSPQLLQRYLQSILKVVCTAMTSCEAFYRPRTGHCCIGNFNTHAYETNFLLDSRKQYSTAWASTDLPQLRAALCFRQTYANASKMPVASIIVLPKCSPRALLRRKRFHQHLPHTVALRPNNKFPTIIKFKRIVTQGGDDLIFRNRNYVVQPSCKPVIKTSSSHETCRYQQFSVEHVVLRRCVP